MPENSTAIVVGASSGIGKATAIALAGRGYNLMLVARRGELLQPVAEDARRQSDRSLRVQTLAQDAAAADAGRRIVDAAMAALGRIDVLANVAGLAPQCPIAAVTAEQWRAVVDANLSYALLLTAAVWPVFERQRGGLVVNVSSLASVDPLPGFVMYACAKTGLNMLTHVIAQEGAPIGVRSVCIAPGAVETPMLRALVDTDTLPTHRTYQPRHVAALICDCVTGARQFTSGETIQMPNP